MRKLITKIGLASVAVASSLSLAFTPTASAMSMKEGADSARGVDQVADLFGTTGIFTTVTNTLLFVVGAISVIMIVIGGLRYVVSGGDSANITTAKNTILYAVVGLIVAMLAYAMIDFVISSFAPGGAGAGATNV